MTCSICTMEHATETRDRYLEAVERMAMGLARAWMKRVLHTTFIYKFKGNPGRKIIPE